MNQLAYFSNKTIFGIFCLNVPPNNISESDIMCFLFQAKTTCPPDCICGEHQNWETEHLLLNRLEEVEVTRMRGSEHEVTFVKQLFIWATSVEKTRVFFDESVTESVAKELSQVLQKLCQARSTPGNPHIYGHAEDDLYTRRLRHRGCRVVSVVFLFGTYELLICWHAEWRSRRSCLDHQYNDSVMHIYKPFMKNGQDDLSFFHDKAPNWTVAVAKFPGSRVFTV
jgi:hypothetical protein